MLLMVVIVSVIALSSAQPDSPGCIEAYNATFNNNSNAACKNAYSALMRGDAKEEQSMMVCSTSQQCNIMIETSQISAQAATSRRSLWYRREIRWQ